MYFGPKYSASNKSKIVLINFLFRKAKMAIWLTRKRTMLFNNDTDPLHMFRAMVKSRLVVEYKYYEIVNDTEYFLFLWGVGNMLSKSNEEGGCDILL